MDLSNFDPNAHRNKYQDLPVGQYKVVITEVKEMDREQMTHMIKMQVIEGEYQGRVLVNFITRNGPNKSANDMGNIQTADMIRALGFTPAPIERAYNVPIDVKVTYKEKTPQSGEYWQRISYLEKASQPAPQQSQPGFTPPPFARS